MSELGRPEEQIEYKTVSYAPSDVIIDNEMQVRVDIETQIPKIAQSIKQHGLQERPKARLDEQGRPHIFWGHTRFLAIRDVLKWPSVELDIAKIDAKQAVMLMIVENVDRHDYSPIEEARAYQVALDRGWTPAELAAKWKHKATFIEDRVKLLGLPDVTRQLIHARKLGVEAAIELLAAPTSDLQKQLGLEITREHMTLKQAQQHIARGIEEYEEYEAFKKAVAASKFKTCPTCKRPAFKPSQSYQVRERDRKAGLWVTCQDFGDYQGKHDWNLTTGKTLEQTREAERAKDTTATKEKRPKPVIRVFRYPVPLEIIGPALIDEGLELALKRLKDKVKSRLEIHVDDWSLEVHADRERANLHTWEGFTWGTEHGGVTVNVEKKIYGDKAGNKTKVGSAAWGSQRSVDKSNEKAAKFLESLPAIRNYRKSLKTQARIQ